MPPSEEQMQQQQAAVDQTQPQEEQAQQVYNVKDSGRCQYVLALPKEMIAEDVIRKMREFFKDHKITEGGGKKEFEVFSGKMSDGKPALAIKIPGDRSTLTELLQFLKVESVKVLDTVVKEIEKIFKKEGAAKVEVKDVEEKIEGLFSSGPGHGLGKDN